MFNVIPNSFKIGSFTITFYALCILTGVIVAFIFLLREGKKLGISSEDIYLGTLITVPCAIIGARLWYVLFNLSSFNSFSEVLGFRNGSFEGLSGLGIQGGVIVVVIALIIFSKKRGISLYRLMDAAMPTILIGQIFGRWGNFFNQELFGPAITSEWYKSFVHGLFGGQMFINGAERHPVFFYEGTLNLLGVIFMFVIRRKDRKYLLSGDMAGIYLIWYGSVRIFTESLRLNSGVSEPLMMGPIPVSILTSVLFIIGGVTFLVLKRFKGPKVKYCDVVDFVKDNIPDVILFDLDGTLLNTRDLIDHSFVHTFEHFRPDYKLSDEELDSFFGPTLYQTFSRYSNDKDEVEAMVKYYREYNIANHDSMVKAFNGVYDTLDTLHKKGFKLGVVSSKAKDLVIRGLEITKLYGFIDVVVGYEEIENPKPAPDGILYAIDILSGNDKKEANASEATLEEDSNEEVVENVEANEEATNEEVVETVDETHSEEVVENKETTEIKEEVKEETNKPKLKVMYVGDTLNDILAAKAANVKSCGVLYIKNPEIMLEAKPDFVISKMPELLRICGE